MLTLIIDQPGHLIHIPGTPQTRTPAQIDVTRCNINVIFAYLKSNGIVSFKLVGGEPEKRTEKRQKAKEQINTKESNESRKEREIHKELSEKRFNNIEYMLKQLLDKPEVIKEKIIHISSDDKDLVKRKRKKFEEVDFIPQFQTGNMSIKGETKTTEKSSVDLTESIEKLKQLKGDKK